MSHKGPTRLAPGMKRVSDWLGKRVEVLRNMHSGRMTVKAGTEATVVYARSGLTLTTPPCACCGLGLYIKGVSASDVREVFEDPPAQIAPASDPAQRAAAGAQTMSATPDASRRSA